MYERTHVRCYNRIKKRPAISRGAFLIWCSVEPAARPIGAQRRRYNLCADAGEFLVRLHVHDLELFGVHPGVGPEG